MAISPYELIPSLLRFATEKGVEHLTTTALVKYTYLFEVYCAEAVEGQMRPTDLDWKFVKFGPHAFEIDDAVHELEKQGLIEVSEHTNAEGFAYRLHSLPKYGRQPDKISSFDIPSYVTAHLGNDIRQFQNDLPQLLHKVYFQTEPMEEARPFNVLDFSSCSKRSIENFKPKEMPAIDDQNLERAKALVRRMADKRANRQTAEEGPYDDVYFGGLEELSESADWNDGAGGIAHVTDD